tara:strand:- start:1744 stop:2946 length:1203 start_codon:yes stop_codon:yes gene_type:complete
MSKPFLPELLVPAGSLEKLKVAVQYGANAVYLAGQQFGLRSAAENFTEDELREGIPYAHQHGVQTYVVLNGFLHDKDLETLPSFLKLLEELNVNAVIVSDLGVIETVKQFSTLPIHLSTQASCLNVESGKLWKTMGVKRLILGREASIAEAGKIKKETGLEVELFIHGSMCMAYSGNCVISNFTYGRDSNRGGCNHSCRFNYQVKYKDQSHSSFLFSSKDLMGLPLIEEFSKYEIDSIKVEGRMKSPLYAGTIAKVYSDALKEFEKKGTLSAEKIKHWVKELQKIPSRDFTEASLLHKADAQSVYTNHPTKNKKMKFGLAGEIIDVIENDSILVEVKSPIHGTDTLEILPFEGEPLAFKNFQVKDMMGNSIDYAKTSTVARLPYFPQAKVGQFIRKGASE